MQSDVCNGSGMHFSNASLHCNTSAKKKVPTWKGKQNPVYFATSGCVWPVDVSMLHSVGKIHRKKIPHFHIFLVHLWRIWNVMLDARKLATRCYDTTTPLTMCSIASPMFFVSATTNCRCKFDNGPWLMKAHAIMTCDCVDNATVYNSFRQENHCCCGSRIRFSCLRNDESHFAGKRTREMLRCSSVVCCAELVGFHP